MANDKKFIAKNGLLTPQKAIIGSTTDNNTDTLQVTGSSDLSGTLNVEQGTPGTPTINVINNGVGGLIPAAIIAQFVGDSDSLQVTNNSGGGYKLSNSGNNNNIIFYNNTSGIAVQYAGADRLVISSTGNDLKGLSTSTIDGNRIITVLDQASQGGSFDAATLDGIDSVQFVRSDESDTMDGSYIITGDLTVSGNTTFINTEQLLVADNIFTLNSDFTTGSPTENAGMEIRRGDSANSAFIWDESNDWFKLVSAGTDLGRVITTADEGPGNGFDADTVDGLHGWQFLRSDVDDTANGNITIEGTLIVGDDNGPAFIIMNGSGQDRILYHNNNEIGFLNDTSGWALKSTADGDLEIERDVKASRDLIAEDDITATTGDITATAGDIIATAGAVSANTTVTAGTDVIGQRFVDADDQTFLINPADTSRIKTVDLTDKIRHDGDTNTYLEFPAADTFRIFTGGTQRVNIDNDSADFAQDVYAPNLFVNDAIIHNGDVDTKILFATDDISLQTGGAERLGIDNAGVDVTGDIDVTGTATANIVYASTEMRSPIYYDLSNDSYFGDFASTSEMNSINIDDYIRHRGDTNTYMGFPGADQITFVTGGTQRLYVTDSQVEASVDIYAPRFVDLGDPTYYADPNNTSIMSTININDWLQHIGNEDTRIGFPDSDTVNIQTDGFTRFIANNSQVTITTDLKVDGDIIGGGDGNFAGDVYASQFIDSDDNTYYADPNDTSVMKTIGIDDYIVHNGDPDTKIGFLQPDTLQMDAGGTTVFLAQSTAAEFYVDVYGEDAYFRTFYDNDDSTYYLNPADTTLALNVAGRARVANGALATPAFSFINDTDTGMYRSAADQLSFSAGGNQELIVRTTYVEAPGSMRSPIFYDIPNTAYYGDFASTSQMNRIDIDDYIRHRGDTNTYMGFDANDSWGVWTNGVRRLTSNATAFTSGLEVRAPKFVDSDNNAYYVDPFNTTTSATFNGKVLIGNITDPARWDDNSGNGGISLMNHGSYASGQSTSIGLSGNYAGGYSLMYLNRIDPNANPFNSGNRYIHFYADGSQGTNLSGDSSGNLYWLMLANTSQSYWTQAGGVIFTVNDSGDVVVGGSSAVYSDGGDNTALTATPSNPKLHVNGSIYLNGANDGIIFSRGTASFLKDEELAFGWGSGWYMQDASYLRVRNNTDVYSSGNSYFARYYDTNSPTNWIEPGGGGRLLGNFEFAAISTGTSYSTASIELRESNYTGNGTATPPQIGFHWGGIVASNIAIESSGRIVVRNNPGNNYEKFGASEIHGRKFFDIDNNNYSFEPAISAAWRLQTPTGRLDIGSMNASYTHFQTDRPRYYFDKPISFDGNISGYNGNETASFARYYDSNDPTFWADPHAESIFNTLKLYNKAAPINDFVALTIDNGDGTGDIDQPESWIQFSFRDSNANFTPQVRIGGRAGYNTGSANDLDKEGSGNFIVQTSQGTGAAGAGSIRDTFSVDYLGNSTSLTSSRAPIFYDWTNTNWYVNPDGDSRMNTITLDGNAVQLREPTGNYGSFKIDGGARGGYEGFSIGDRVVFMHNNGSVAGMYNDVNNEWLMRFDLNGSNILYFNGTSQASTQDGYFLAENEIRAPIFRDTSSPTTWFVDPAGTSRVNTLRTNRIYPCYDNNTGIYIDYPGGNYGSIAVHGSGKGGWEGYSIADRYVFMSADANQAGIFNDIDNEWMTLWYRGGSTELYYNGGKQAETENGYFLANNQMRAPVYYPPGTTTWFLDLDAGNTSNGLRIPNRIRRDNFQTSGDGNNNVLLDTQDYTHWIWRTASNWGIMWAGNTNPYRSYFSTSNPNELVFIGSGNLRASIDLDDGRAHFTGRLTAPDIAIANSTAGSISLNPAYGSGGADLVLFDFTQYSLAEITVPLKGNEANNIQAAEYVEVSNAPFAGKAIRTSGYRVFYSDYIPVVPGEDVYGEISHRRISGSGGRLYYGIERFDKDKRPIAGNTGTTYFVVGGNIFTNTGWQTQRSHTTIPTSHTPYSGSDGGGVYYVRIRILMNYSSGGALREFGGIMLKRRNVESNLLVDNVVANDILADDIVADQIDAYRFRDRDSTGYYIEPANTSESIRTRARHLNGPNLTWGSYLQVGGNGREYTNNGNVASVVTTNGNLHLDGASGKEMYLNYYDGSNIYFGTGGNAVHSRWQNNGDLYIGGSGAAAQSGFKLDVNGSIQARGDLYANIFRDRANPTGRYVDPASTSQIEYLNVNLIKSFPSPDYGQLYFQNGGQTYPSGRSQVVSLGLGIYSGYSTGGGRPFTYDVTASFNAGGKGFEIAADWINTNRTPLLVRSLRDCCQNWTPWTQIATSGVQFNTSAGIVAPWFADNASDFYRVDPASTSQIVNMNMRGTLNMEFGAQINLRAPGTNTLRGYIQVRDTNDGHLRIATSGGEDIRFMDGGLDGDWNMIVRGNGDTLIREDIEARIFKDRDDPGNYFGNFASTSAMNTVDVNRLRTRGSTGYFWDGNADLAMLVYGEISNSNYAAGNLQPGTLNIGRTDRNYNWDGSSWAGSINAGMIAHTVDDWEWVLHDSGRSVESVIQYTHTHGYKMGRSIGWGTTRVVHEGGTASTIYTDWTNTGYFLNPAENQNSNINGVNARTMAMLSMPGHTRDSGEYYRARPRITGDTNYWTGSMGWGRQDMTNTVADWGSGFIDSWSNPANQPSGTSHWVGMQAYHYSNGSSRYGWQMVGGPITGLRFRSTWGSFRAWRHMTIYGVNDAPTGSSGYLYGRRFVDSDSDGYYGDFASTSRFNSFDTNEAYNRGWYRNTTNARGLYSQANARHFYSPGSAYWHLDSSNGLILYDRYNSSQGSSTGRKGYLYFDSSGFGLLHSGGGWAVRAVNGTTELYGNAYAGTFRANIIYDRNNGDGWYWNGGGTSRSNVTITNTSYFSSNTSRGYAEGYSSRGSALRRISFITMTNGSSNWNSYNYHGIASTNTSNNFSDSISINSYNDITMRIDSNSNNTNSYFRIMDNTPGSATNVCYIGRENGNAIAYFYNRVYGQIFYDISTSTYRGDFGGTSRLNQLTVNRINSPYAGSNSGLTRASLPYSYGFQESGNWSFPYPDMVFQYHTGVSFAANPSYGGMRFFNDYNSNTVRFQINGGSGSTLSHNFSNTWFHVAGAGVGIRSSYNTATFVPNNASSYGSWNITGSRSGWRGLAFTASTYRPHLMFDGSSSGGYYIQDLGRWVYYHNRSNNCTGFASSSTLSGYRVRINGSLYCNGNVVAYSDRRKKKNIVTIDNALDKVLQLRGVYYERKEDLIDDRDDLFKGRQLGMIAQEVLEVVPEVVSYAEEADEYGLDYPKMIGLLVEAHKDQQEIINKQQEKVDKLEELVYNLMNKMENQ
tara:strand:+ start:1243 stop:11277 length:10035 start_codon:yes stop_codon:yes gene_type:complete